MSNKGNKKVTFNEFLNPKSMLTPGIAGSLTTLFTNTLAAQFGCPPNYTGLVISFVFGLIVFAATSTALWLRLVFWIFNSLFIFSIAIGTNQVGVRTAKSTSGTPLPLPPTVAMIQLKTAFFANWLDGTVPRRTKLLTEIGQLDESKAKDALAILGVEVTPELAKVALERSVASARTAENMGQLESAIALAVKPKPDS